MQGVYWRVFQGEGNEKSQVATDCRTERSVWQTEIEQPCGRHKGLRPPLRQSWIETSSLGLCIPASKVMCTRGQQHSEYCEGRQSEQTCGYSWGKRGWTRWESSVETYTAAYGEQTARGNLLCDSGTSNPGLCDSLEGWDGVGSESGSTERGQADTDGWFMLMYGKHQYTIVKQLSSN